MQCQIMSPIARELRVHAHQSVPPQIRTVTAVHQNGRSYMNWQWDTTNIPRPHFGSDTDVFSRGSAMTASVQTRARVVSDENECK